uniref:Uncharacterized protein n=1 Tax=Rhizophora mucronata TaxID=61149 RepID=A0A2P2NZH2_RHIMU
MLIEIEAFSKLVIVYRKYLQSIQTTEAVHQNFRQKPLNYSHQKWRWLFSLAFNNSWFSCQSWGQLV